MLIGAVAVKMSQIGATAPVSAFLTRPARAITTTSRPSPRVKISVPLDDLDWGAEQVAERRRRQRARLRTILDDTPLLEQDDAVDLRNDVRQVVGDEDHRHA